MIVRVTDPGVFDNPLVREFFLAATKAHKFFDPKVVDDLANMVTQPEIGCFVEVGQNGAKAVVTVMLPQSAFMECPQVLMLYGKHHEATKQVIQAGLKFCTDAGYNRAWGLNRAGVDTAVLERLFGYAGFARPIGTLMEYEF